MSDSEEQQDAMSGGDAPRIRIERRPQYWCHKCKATVSVDQNVTCTQCGDAFVEEIAEDYQPATVAPTTLRDLLMMIARPSGGEAQGSGAPQFVFRTASGSTSSGGISSEGGSSDATGAGPGGLGGGLASIFQQLFSGFERFNSSARSGDYVHSNSGFEALLQQLMEQADGGPGVEPADEDTLSKCVTKCEVTPDLLGKDCAICQESFQEKEKLSSLVCKHSFHDECILPWLQIHATCPVCRCNLHEQKEGETTAMKE